MKVMASERKTSKRNVARQARAEASGSRGGVPDFFSVVDLEAMLGVDVASLVAGWHEYPRVKGVVSNVSAMIRRYMKDREKQLSGSKKLKMESKDVLPSEVDLVKRVYRVVWRADFSAVECQRLYDDGIRLYEMGVSLDLSSRMLLREEVYDVSSVTNLDVSNAVKESVEKYRMAQDRQW